MQLQNIDKQFICVFQKYYSVFLHLLACVYTALILADDDVAITPEKITIILKAAGVEVELCRPGLFAKALESCDLKTLITTVGPGAGAAPGAVGATPAAEAAPAKKEESEKEEDDDMGFGLFG